MQAQVKTWENSQGIELSKDILQVANISIDDIVELSVSDGVIPLVNAFTHKALEERAAAFSGNLHLDGEFDFGVPVGREGW